MRTRLVLGVGLLVLVAAVAFTLAPSEPRRSGTNNMPLAGPVARLAPGADVCQGEDVPEQTRTVRVFVEPKDAPRIAVRLTGPGRSVAGRDGRVAADGAVDVAFDRPVPSGAVEVCVRNRSARRAVALGFPTGVRDGPVSGVMRIDYYRAGNESWWALATTIADRAALGRSGVLGGALLWVGLALVLAAWGLAVAALWRIGAPE